MTCSLQGGFGRLLPGHQRGALKQLCGHHCAVSAASDGVCKRSGKDPASILYRYMYI